MRTFVILAAILSVMGLSYWAYQQNYRTQAALDESEALQRQIGAARARLGVLRAEWAYLNRPDRLRELSEMNFTRLELGPMRPDQFGRVDELAYPDQGELPVIVPIDVANRGPQTAEAGQ